MLRRLLRWFSFEPESKTPEPKPCASHKNPLKIGAGAVEQNMNFIHNHWDEYPEYIQDHMKREDLINEYSKELSALSYKIDYTMKELDRFLRLTKEAGEEGIALPGILKLIDEYDYNIADYNARIKKIPNIIDLKKLNKEIEKRVLGEGWVCWYGTGGLHWCKKGVVEDGYGVYER